MSTRFSRSRPPEEETVRSTPWRRLRVTDSPRPAGRGMKRFRRSGSLARRLVTIRPMHPIKTLRQRRSGDIHVLRSTDLLEAPAASVSTSIAPPVAKSETDTPTASMSLLPGEPTAKRRFFFALANAFTVISIVLGMSAIMLSISGQVQLAATLLLGSILMDGVDGPVARRFGVSSPFGAQMDSMADMCSFGVATPIVVFCWLNGSLPTWTLAVSCSLVGICAGIRLARFNVSPKDGRFFSGVPTTLAGTVLALSVLLVQAPTVAMVAGIGLLALMMVSAFPYAKIGQISRVPAWLWPLPVIGMLLLNVEIVFLALVLAYLMSGPLLWVINRRDNGSAAPA